MDPEGLICAYAGAQNAVVTITYLDGTVPEAIVLSHKDDEIRAMAAGCDDVLAFIRIHGPWISEEIEPVAIEFEWQRLGPSPATSEDDCVCPKKLAAHLIRTLLIGGEPKEVQADAPYVFSTRGSPVAVLNFSSATFE
jgi:hypothetical protein